MIPPFMKSETGVSFEHLKKRGVMCVVYSKFFIELKFYEPFISRKNQWKQTWVHVINCLSKIKVSFFF
ncbi:MAG: hypothetical protein A2277_15255 [Desulfobacterales bacterium RIFOXYA12_FULL_46_15]|nr:MAG: hypothetical protein A2277_15255 [Desulfobacterales bacterium RIFOXYA12_FULL_46_15]